MTRKPTKHIEPEAPDLPPSEELGDLDLKTITDRAMLERVRLSEGETPINANSVMLDQSLIVAGALAGSRLPGVMMSDCLFDHADLAGASWTDARIQRTKFVECRLSGFDLRMGELRDVVFERCKMPDSFFSEMKLIRVRFDDCQLTNLDLSFSAIESLAMRDCNARFLRLNDARVSHCDLRGSTIDGISFDVKSAPGLVIEPVQSPAIASSMGVRVIDRDH